MLNAIDRLAETEEGDVKRLKGRPGIFRLRVGDWRVLHSYDTDEHVINVARVLHRGDAYR